MEKKMYETPEMEEIKLKMEENFLATISNEQPGGGSCTGEGGACLCPTDDACETEN